MIWTEFEALTSTKDANAASAIRCGNEQQHLLLKGRFGEPTLLISCETRHNPRPSISLKHISVAFDTMYEVMPHESSEIKRLNFSRITCAPESHTLHKYFVEVLVAVANSLPSKLSETDVDEVISSLLELFRKFSFAPTRAVSGLWGELIVIFSATNPGVFIDAWHLTVSDTFDFTFSDCRLEVKATERSVREHEVSLSQVRGGRSGDALVSVRLSRSAAGDTVLDLTRRIAALLSQQQQVKLWQLVLETLGQNADASGEQSFDVQQAVRDLLFFSSSSIPAPIVSSSDAGLISDVRYRVNLSALPVVNHIDGAPYLKRARR